MKRANIFGLLAALAAMLVSAGLARAQAPAVAAAAAAPIVSRVISVVAPRRNPQAKGNWLKAEVIHFDIRSLTVREQSNERMIHTFTYDPTLQSKVKLISDQGGYQFGDRVKILFQPGQTVALQIRGKPSKPL